jgi:hypothetical protein
MLKTSYVTNYGTFREAFNLKREQWFNYLSVEYSSLKYGKLKAMLGLDLEKQGASQFGAGLTYQYLF